MPQGLVDNRSLHFSGISDMAGPSFTSHFYTSADGLKLHYREYPGPADAPFTVLCMPGLTRNARDFEDLAPHLALKYRVLCADLRGRGGSEYAKDPFTYVPPVYVRDIAALLKSAGLARVALVGTSLGGIISMIMASVMSTKVLGVVLNDIGPEINPAGLARIAGYLGKSKPIATWDEAAAAVQMLDGTIFPEYQTSDWLRMARRRFVQSPADGSFRPDYDLDISKPFAGNAAAVDLWPFFLAMERIPVLAIRGGLSDFLSADVFARMKRELPHLHQVTVPNRGHAPYLDEPEAIAGIDSFLATLPTRLGAPTILARTLSSLIFLVKLKIRGVA